LTKGVIDSFINRGVFYDVIGEIFIPPNELIFSDWAIINSSKEDKQEAGFFL